MKRRVCFALVLAAAGIFGGCLRDSGEHLEGEPPEPRPWPPSFSMVLGDVGLSGPGSALHDPAEDVYLVANANGSLTERDGNGFVSRISPIGQVQDLKWLDGNDPGVTLHAPRGMSILADTLFVADVDCLRRFHRVTGEPLLETCLDPARDLLGVATALTAVVATSWGDVYFSEVDTTLLAGAVYLMKSTAEVPQTLAMPDGTLLEGSALGGPKGLALDQEGLLVATFGSGELFRITHDGDRIQLLEPSDLRLHGVLALGDRGVLVSSWGDSAVYNVALDGRLSVVVSSIATPATMGYDSVRGRILIPLQASHQLLVVSAPLPPPGQGVRGGP
jgi:hypothetical protein